MEHAHHLLEEDERTLTDMRRFNDGWLGRARIGTSMTVLMYVLPPILQRLKTDHPQLEITLKAGLTANTLRMLKTNELDLGLCALPIDDVAFEAIPLFEDELIAIVPAGTMNIPKNVTPAFFSKHPLIIGNEASTLHQSLMAWFATAGPPPKPIMVFDNVEAIKRLVAVGLGASIIPRQAVKEGHSSDKNIRIVRITLGVKRRIALVRLKGKRDTAG